jgi:hypothetical protein
LIVNLLIQVCYFEFIRVEHLASDFIDFYINFWRENFKKFHNGDFIAQNVSFNIRDGFSLERVFNNSCFFFYSVFTDFTSFNKHIINIFRKGTSYNIKYLIRLGRWIENRNWYFSYIRVSDFIRSKRKA